MSNFLIKIFKKYIFLLFLYLKKKRFNISQKDCHNERLFKLKLLLIEIEEDNWKYDNVSKLIGI
jgi:hypothetical protein